LTLFPLKSGMPGKGLGTWPWKQFGIKKQKKLIKYHSKKGDKKCIHGPK
jgi:hypothetical protein